MGTSAPAETFDMVFHVQLAHGSPTKQVRDFTNVKQLYESIAKVFGIATESILYCTLNTHKIDMTRLLGGQIGLDDFMFAHIASPDGAKEAMGGTGNVGAGSGKKTLRMKKDGTAVVEEIDDAVVKIVGEIDDMLDSFIGIRDIELSQTIYDKAKAAGEADLFAEELDKALSDFEFPDDFVLDVFDKVNA